MPALTLGFVGVSALAATPGQIAVSTSQSFRLADLVEERGRVTASTKYQVALIFPVTVEHVAVPVLKQGVFKATVAGKIVYLDVAKSGGRATLSVSLGDAGLAQFDVALTDREDGVTRYTVSQGGPAAGTTVAVRASSPPASPAPRSAASATPARTVSSPTVVAAPKPLLATPSPRSAPPALPKAPAVPVPNAPSAAVSPPRPSTSPRAFSASQNVRTLTQLLVTRGLSLTFTTRRDGPNTLVSYRVTGSASLRPEDLTVQDALGAKVPATFLERAAKPGTVYGKLRVASNASLLRLRWVAKGADGAFFPITKTLFVR